MLKLTPKTSFAPGVHAVIICDGFYFYDKVMFHGTVYLKIKTLSRWAWPNHMRAFEAQRYLKLILGEEVWDLGLKKDLTLHCWFEQGDGIWQGMWAASRSWGQPQATSQQGNRNLCSSTTRNWILPQTMSLGVGSSEQPPDENSARPTPWFQPCDALRREHSHRQTWRLPTKL